MPNPIRRILNRLRPKPTTQTSVYLSCSECGWEIPAIQHEAHHAMAEVTLRDLIRAARAAGAPLRRDRHANGIEYYQCWDEGAHRRRALVKHWSATGTWRVEIFAADGLATDHWVRVDMQQPTIPEIVAAARLCGWDLAVDRGEAP